MRGCQELPLLAVLIAAACIQGPEAVLVFDMDRVPPDTTEALAVTLAGRVVRSPATERPLTVTVSGGAAVVSRSTNQFGLFTIDVPLLPNTTNELELVATDDRGTRSEPRRWSVVQITRTASPQPAGTARGAPR